MLQFTERPFTKDLPDRPEKGRLPPRINIRQGIVLKPFPVSAVWQITYAKLHSSFSAVSLYFFTDDDQQLAPPVTDFFRISVLSIADESSFSCT